MRKINTKIIATLLMLLLIISVSYCQQTKLKIISDIEEYNKSVTKNPENALVDIEKVIPGIILDIRYATKNNFTNQQIYKSPKAFVRKSVAEALLKIENELNQKGIGLKIFDAYRPYTATVKFYEVYPDKNFVASPLTGSIHNRGCCRCYINRPKNKK